MGSSMNYSELHHKYQNLRNDLEAAYASQVWDDCRIDFIASQLVETELAMAKRSRRVTSESTQGAMATDALFSDVLVENIQNNDGLLVLLC